MANYHIEFNKKTILIFLKNIFQSTTKKRLLENFFSLSLLQIANYLLPIITLPYLVRILGPEKFGLLAFYQSFVQFFYILTDYGFNFSATRDISLNRENKERVSVIFSTVIILKVALIIISLFFVSFLIFVIPKFNSEWLVLCLTFGSVIGQALFPRWFFQGIEKMKYITIMNILAKLFFVILVFVLVKNASDYIYVPLLNSLGYISVGIISLIIILKKFRVKLVKPTLNEFKFQLIEGWHLFISTFATSLYTTANAFILGLFSNNTVVGYYSAAEKIIKAIEDLISPIFYTVYPYLSRQVEVSREKAIDLIKKILKLVGISTFLISIFIFFFSGLISEILLGNNYSESILILKILSFIPFIGGINIILTSLTMLSFNFKKGFSTIIISAGLINVILAFSLVPNYLASGSAIAVNLAELYILLATTIYLNKQSIYLFKR